MVKRLAYHLLYCTSSGNICSSLMSSCTAILTDSNTGTVIGVVVALVIVIIIVIIMGVIGVLVAKNRLYQLLFQQHVK